MTGSSEFPQSLHPASLGKRILQGAGLAFGLVVVFMTVFARGANMPFGLWTVLPLLTVPVAGAFGGIVYHLMDYLRYQGSWQKLAANGISILVYFVGLWVSLVAAFAFTGLWD
ncbi:potassium transporter KefB [Hymenobacter guriensis]|uniref:Potassium transporter KefB n=1 Tax=Hymenobacter guriensis TaxID=2793065 RepID=A0ABS0L0X8_9BACT|nr:potassium transporter KefB [Hymenobacter guriensis]MBG8553767.1 potassium transporter KefB [Hymenobacter guriensis]